MNKPKKPLEITFVDDFKDFDNFPDDYYGKYLVMNGPIYDLRRSIIFTGFKFCDSIGFFTNRYNFIMSKTLSKFLQQFNNKKETISIIFLKTKEERDVAFAAFSNSEYVIDFSFSQKFEGNISYSSEDFREDEKQILKFLDEYREDLESWIKARSDDSKDFNSQQQKEARARELQKKEELRAKKISDIVAKEQTKDGPNRYKVKVLRIVHYGAVVDLGNGLEGVIPITDSKWPSKLKPGDELSTEIYEMDITLKIV